jgi:hypothetical protein
MKSHVNGRYQAETIRPMAVIPLVLFIPRPAVRMATVNGVISIILESDAAIFDRASL